MGYVTATRTQMEAILGFAPNAEMEGLPEWRVVCDHNPKLAFTVYTRFFWPAVADAPVEWHIGGCPDALRLVRQAMRRAGWDAEVAFDATRPLVLA